MKSFKERRSDQLFSASTKLWIIAAFALLAMGVFAAFETQRGGENQEPSQQAPATVAEMPTPDNDQDLLKPKGIDEATRQKIEKMFNDIPEAAEAKEKALLELRRVLHEVFSGQEDCWSCEGAVYFDKWDLVAGREESRQPLSLKDWIDEAEADFQSHQLDKAREAYSSALRVLEEQMDQEESVIDSKVANLIKNRCQQLGCR